MSEFAIFVDGDITVMLDGLSKQNRARAASQALNKVTREGRTEFARRIRAQINVPAAYVSPSQNRLAVARFATPGNLETEIRARGRATSLARFVTGSPGVNKPGVGIQVARGKSQFLKNAFLIRLPGIGGATDTINGNLGLAVRLRRGQRLSNKTQGIMISKGLYLLYGPSVAQVFENNAGSGTKQDYSPELAADLEREFLRLLDRS